eukprot:3081082-Rhodomonas_salina.2
MPDEVSRLVNLKQLKASHNFMGDPPPEVIGVSSHDDYSRPVDPHSNTLHQRKTDLGVAG